MVRENASPCQQCLTQNEIKEAVGKKAASLVKEGMLVGLGSGTTAVYFIKHLGARCRAGLKIQAVSSSMQSLKIAEEEGIPTVEMDRAASIDIDLMVDGADEVDPQKRVIKGGGGAHSREKIIATSSREMIVVVDESKLVDQLGKFGLPVEILSFGYLATIAKIEKMGYQGKLRLNQQDGSLVKTDNENYIFDINYPTRFPDPEKDHDLIKKIPGVVETGFFFGLPVKVLVGYKDGKVAFRE
ncbi:MAG: ribose 5-phosphate isomerase A [Chlamydiales bacterium]